MKKKRPIAVTNAATYDPAEHEHATGHPLDDNPSFAGRLGISPAEAARLTLRSTRLRIAKVLDNGGESEVAQRIRYCGRAVVGITVKDRARVVLPLCRQRLCPRCARAKATTDAELLRQWIAQRGNGRPIFLFGTLTQMKLEAKAETCGGAISRVMDTWRRLVNVKFASGRQLRKEIVGLLRVIEVTWSNRGYGGWHAHIHFLAEVRTPAAKARVAAIIQRHWLAISPGASKGAQHITDAGVESCAEIVKYVVKALDIKSPRRLQEAARELKSRRLQVALWEWRGWRKQVRLDRPKLIRELTGVGLNGVIVAAKRGEWITWDQHVGEGVMVRHAADTEKCIRDIARDPRPAGAERAPPPVDGYRTLAWLLGDE